MSPSQLLIPSLCLVGGAHGCAPAGPAPDPAGVDTVTGMFHTVWSGGDPAQRFFLTDSSGTTYSLMLTDSVFAAAGGHSGLDRRRVRVIGRAGEGRTLRVLTVEALP